MPVSNYDTGFEYGLTVRNIPIEIAQNGDSKTFWVNSIVGHDVSLYGNFLHPYASLAYAISKCSGNGDRIYVAAGHVENVIAAGGLNLNVPGVTIEFLGEGSLRGTINFSTIVGASMTMTAAGVTLINPRFTAGIDALTGPISITAADCNIINGEWFDGTLIDTTNCIVATTAATRLGIYGWKYFSGSETGTQKQSNISLVAVSGIILKNIDIRGNFSVACINNATTACPAMTLTNVLCKNTNATPYAALVLQTACKEWLKMLTWLLRAELHLLVVLPH
jgi:hypothetical protein